MTYKKQKTYQDYENSYSQPTNRCGCVDANGNPKKYYQSITDAKNAQSYVLLNHGVETKVYECPSGKGYHLTSHYE